MEKELDKIKYSFMIKKNNNSIPQKVGTEGT